MTGTRRLRTQAVPSPQPEGGAGAAAAGTFPCRDCSDLWACAATVDCARRRLCVPCAYKVACFDVALDADFCRRVPNQRPEACPRSVTAAAVAAPAPAPGLPLGYRRGLRVLTVGDGDFSFGLALARCGVALTATSYENHATLRRVYPGLDEKLAELRDRGAAVFFGVDATDLSGTLPVRPDTTAFDRIVWNFPCSAIANGQDGQNKEMEFNKSLVRRFLLQAINYLEPTGQVHMNHKTKPPFNQWRIENVALELRVETERQKPLFRLVGRVVLDRCLFPPYVPRKALDRKSFPVHDACTYIFSLEPQSMATACGGATQQDGMERVTPELIASLRERHLLSEAKPPLSHKRQKRI